MNRYKPQTPFNVPFILYTPTTTKTKGVITKTYTENPNTYYCSFRTFGGTESNENGVYSIINTATVETWYTPIIKADCRIKLLQTNQIYDIISTPENINMRNQYLKFKVKAVEGKA